MMIPANDSAFCVFFIVFLNIYVYCLHYRSIYYFPQLQYFMLSALNKSSWLTLTELIVSITITVIFFGGIFYFLSETLLGFEQNTTKSNFLNDFYEFLPTLENWNFTVLSTDWYHIWLLESPVSGDWIIIWVINKDTLQLITPENKNTYLPAIIWYRQVTASEILSIQSNPISVYSLLFQRDSLFETSYINNFELYSYNSWTLHEILFEVFPLYYPNLNGVLKTELAIENKSKYSLVF